MARHCGREDRYMIGTRLSHHLVLEKFGAGGMGAVYKADE
jgi:hypothetical protein